MTFVSLFKLADFLEMDRLRRDMLHAFRDYNIKKAIAIQQRYRPAWIPGLGFVGNFTEAAKIAYTLLLTSRHQHPNDGLAKIPRDPVGIRRPFIEFLRFTRLHIKGSKLTELLTHLEEHHHELMEDIIRAIVPRILECKCQEAPVVRDLLQGP